jgi:hypothetical protein
MPRRRNMDIEELLEVAVEIYSLLWLIDNERGEGVILLLRDDLERAMYELDTDDIEVHPNGVEE